MTEATALHGQTINPRKRRNSMHTTQSPIVTKLAISLAGEMLHMAVIQDEANHLNKIEADDRTWEEEERLDELAPQANCLAETTTVLRGCFLALYPQFVSDPVEVYKWALASFASPNLSEEEARALTSLQISAKDDLGDYRTEAEKLPPIDLPMVDVPEEQMKPNLRERLRQRGSDAKDSPFVHRQEMRVHKVQRGIHKVESGIHRKIRGAFARVKGRLVKAKTNIMDRPHYRLKFVEAE
jgi:hypothetical protein